MISAANQKIIIIISPHHLIDNYNYNYYITENETKLVYSYIFFVLSVGVLHTFLWKRRGQ
jgi:hypothetical protein